MNPLLVRLGQLESRRTIQTLWTSGSTKRAHWVCAECRAHKQRRGYSDEPLRWPGSNASVEQAAQEESRGPWGLQRERTISVRRVGSGELRSGERNQDERAARASGVEADFFDRNEASNVGAQETQHGSEAASRADVLWEQFEQDPSEHSLDTPDIDDETPETSIPKDSLLSVDYKTELPLALSRRSVDLTIRCLFSAAQQHDFGFLSAIPAPMFSAIINLVQPGDFLERLADAHMDISNAMAEHMRVAKMREIAFDYNRVILRTLKIRRVAGQTPRLEDYTTLLRSARTLRSFRSANTVWQSMVKDGLHPDTQCFNNYMASMVWNGWHNAGMRRKARVVPYTMKKRAAPKTRDTFRFGNYRIGKSGIKEKTMKTFSEMLAFGAVADVESFRILITACAREGDIKTVNAMLHRVWGIDVPAIMESRDEVSIAPTDFSDNPSMQPNEGLLATLAHAFGVNNDLPTALRVVDFVARHYRLDITRETWDALLEWTYVLTDKDSPGRLPWASVISLWNTMKGPPYSITPSLVMYNLLISNLADGNMTFQMIDRMNEALPLAQEDEEVARTARDRLIAALQEQQAEEVVEQVRREWEYARLIQRRNDFWLRNWIRMFLISVNQRKSSMSAAKAEQLLEIPRVLWEWRRFASDLPRYETATGFVEIELRDDEEGHNGAAAYANILEVMTQLKSQSRRYVGDTWMIDHEESEEIKRHMEKRRRMRRALIANGHDRKLIETSMPKYSAVVGELEDAKSLDL
ncbi:hypothetical protein CB0940_02825 [Cercospora beticola]|uniref:Pentatricopeptide repeat-containing protein n=1 Tax=Cercospora beticola TaxID=122368 RepID=A0A2G5I5V2_CERBT|nr:hypothetical protein CB0940_02825 [Cercospora beticola]PIA99852.1 hypothetical protein CB0940_02825 [Cercospora beticola]WPA99975.1 hypothetical protein RHO25_004595 [Cercospora beticola]CAK1361848.1 unnamed protein product [Cercospora beticola]